MVKLTNHFQRTRFITSLLTGKHYSLDSYDYLAQVVKTSVINNRSFLNYPHPDDHTSTTIPYLVINPQFLEQDSLNKHQSIENKNRIATILTEF